MLDQTWDEGTGGRDPSGARATVLRVFDDARACAVVLGGRTAWTIGAAIDLAPLDLLDFSTTELAVPWAYDATAIRALIAQLAAEADAHFDTSATWPGATTDRRTFPEADGLQLHAQRFAAGAHAVEVVEHTYGTGRRSVRAALHGLPWGHEVAVFLDEEDARLAGHLRVRLPRAAIASLALRLEALRAGPQ